MNEPASIELVAKILRTRRVVLWWFAALSIGVFVACVLVVPHSHASWFIFPPGLGLLIMITVVGAIGITASLRKPLRREAVLVVERRDSKFWTQIEITNANDDHCTVTVGCGATMIEGDIGVAFVRDELLVGWQSEAISFRGPTARPQPPTRW